MILKVTIVFLKEIWSLYHSQANYFKYKILKTRRYCHTYLFYITIKDSRITKEWNEKQPHFDNHLCFVGHCNEDKAVTDKILSKWVEGIISYLSWVHLISVNYPACVLVQFLVAVMLVTNSICLCNLFEYNPHVCWASKTVKIY